MPTPSEMMSRSSTTSDDARFEKIRRTAIVALFSDDVLYEKLVLKGGNALNLVHRIGLRSSVDIDVSMEGDFEDLDEARARVFRALERTFREEGFRVFDQKLEPRPRKPSEDPRWGGYELRFKVVALDRAEAFADDPDTLRRRAETVAPGSKRNFKVDFSKHEHCQGKIEVELDEYSIFVYSLEMIALEKIRALCQQMEPYTRTKRLPGRARPRDFYDLVVIQREHGLDLASPENRALARDIFDAKDVPFSLLESLETQRDFHRTGWEDVALSVSEPLEPFDVYFDAVIAMVELLYKPLG
ncbi:MAG: nucleotidyl transferase AbiEii/AbiGii toxin family protein [Holophagales bacterium]|nr:nucleotidyl transferase AbiEii/AbiGii toxin family protein [Holophagales bacterium]